MLMVCHKEERRGGTVEWPFMFFCNKCNSFLSFGKPQWYNLEALRFTYDQYVVIELVCFCVSLDKQFFQVAGAGDQTTDPWITKSALYL